MKVSFFEDHLGVKTSIAEVDFSEISIDTRSLRPSALFIALKGSNFDGNKFVDEAFKKGSLCCVVDDPALEKKEQNIFYTKNTKVFLKKIAKAWVEHLDPYVIGVTGSNGKTTTKFFTAQVLSDFFPLHYSPKSFNNDIGLPLTQLGLKKEHKLLICEMGTNSPGEIEALTKQAPADLSMVTTVGSSHLDKLINLEGVFNEKKDIYVYSKHKSAIFNLDNSYTKKMYDLYNKNFDLSLRISSTDKTSDVYVQVLKESLTGLHLRGHLMGEKFEVQAPVFGAYNVYNIMFALASGLILKIAPKDLVKTVKKLRTPWGRSQILKDKSKRTYVFDGYNSNLQSMTSLLESLKSEPSENLHLILGEMLELGEQSHQHHKELGKLAGGLNPKSITFLGDYGESFLQGLEEINFKKNITISNTYNKQLALKVKSMLDEKDVVVLKASRGTEIEQFLVDLEVD